MKDFHRAIFGFAAGAMFFAMASVASAATLFLSPPTTAVGPSQKFSIDVKVDGAGVGFNAAQATIRFPKDLLQVSSIDKTSSAFSFWLEDPVFSNDQGVISFIGGSPFGVSGAAIQVLRVNFTPKGTGTGTVSVTDAAITASDGSGTNILSTTTSASITVSPANVASAGAVTAPQQITRTPTPATGTPAAPSINVSLYPDPTQWYDQVSPFSVSWSLPADISAVATAINKQPNFDPVTSEGLFDNKTFNALSDGIWYLHVRFKNSFGWSTTVHSRIAIDTEPPLGFKITMQGGDTTDDPAPVLQFKTDDALSGMKEYDVMIDNHDPIVVPAKGFVGTFTLPLQAPGDHRVQVRTVDNAGNSVEDFITLHILPIASPTISFTTSQLFSDEPTGLTVQGSALPNIEVILNVHQADAIMASSTVETDAQGNWRYTFSEPLHNGTYNVSAVSRDARGALSLTVESPSVVVKNRPILEIGSFQLGSGGAAVLLLIILFGGFGSGVWFYRKRNALFAQRLVAASRDLSTVFDLIRKDVERIDASIPVNSEHESVVKHLRENVQKMEVLLKKEIERIDK